LDGQSWAAVGQASSCRCACFRGCSAGCFWKACRRPCRRAPAILWRAGQTRGPRRLRAISAPSRKVEWVVIANEPFGGPEACWPICRATPTASPSPTAAWLACDGDGVAFKYKDYRIEGRARQKIMRLTTDEFIRRFLIHVLPTGFHRIRHYGLFASGVPPKTSPRARPSCSSGDPTRTRQPAMTPINRAARPRASMPMLRRPHDRHRDIRTRTRFARLFARRTQDRHIMIEIASSAAPQLGSLLRWSFDRAAPARPKMLRDSPEHGRREQIYHDRQRTPIATLYPSNVFDGHLRPSPTDAGDSQIP